MELYYDIGTHNHYLNKFCRGSYGILEGRPMEGQDLTSIYTTIGGVLGTPAHRGRYAY